MAISSPSATMKKKIEDTTELIMASPIQSREVFARPATRSAVRRQDDVERSGIARTQFRETALHPQRNGREGDAAVEQGLARDIVERVQLRGGGAAARGWRCAAATPAHGRWAYAYRGCQAWRVSNRRRIPPWNGSRSAYGSLPAPARARY